MTSLALSRFFQVRLQLGAAPNGRAFCLSASSIDFLSQRRKILRSRFEFRLNCQAATVAMPRLVHPATTALEVCDVGPKDSHYAEFKLPIHQCDTHGFHSQSATWHGFSQLSWVFRRQLVQANLTWQFVANVGFSSFIVFWEIYEAGFVRMNRDVQDAGGGTGKQREGKKVFSWFNATNYGSEVVCVYWRDRFHALQI